MLPRGTGLESDRGLALLGGAGHARNGRLCAGEAGKKLTRICSRVFPYAETLWNISIFFSVDQW